MKNIILGAIGCAVAVYIIASCLSIYSISARKNEMENCIAQVLEQDMELYFAQEYSDTQVAAFVKQDILQQLHSSSQVTIDIRFCDMQQGLLSVRVQEKFMLPGGRDKVIICEKTIIVEDTGETEEDETEELLEI